MRWLALCSEPLHGIDRDELLALVEWIAPSGERPLFDECPDLMSTHAEPLRRFCNSEGILPANLTL